MVNESPILSLICQAASAISIIPLILGIYLKISIFFQNLIVSLFSNRESTTQATPYYQAVKIGFVVSVFSLILNFATGFAYAKASQHDNTTNTLQILQNMLYIQIANFGITFVVFVVAIKTILPTSFLQAMSISIWFFILIFLTIFLPFFAIAYIAIA